MFKHQNFKLSRNGVENYFWPISREEVKKLFQELICESSLYFRTSTADPDNKFIEHLKIINLYFVLKVADLYQKKILNSEITNARKNNINIDIFESDINRNKNRYLDIVKSRNWQKINKNRILLNLRNQIVSLYRNDGFKRVELSKVNNNDIVLTGVNPLASEFSKIKNLSVSLVKITDYFQGANPEDIEIFLDRENSEYFEAEKFNRYIEIFTHSLKKRGIELSDEDLSELNVWHKEFSLCISYYQKLLANQTYNLPKKLWTSSAGILWNKLLAIEVRKQGGKVTGFDHANGSTLSIETVFPFIELQEVDIFVTHSKTFVSYFREAAKNQLYYEECPSIISIK